MGWFARLCLLWLPVAGLLALQGCALLPSSKPEATSVEAPAPAERALYRLEVDAPAPLRNLLTTYLDLARFQSTAETEGITPVELNRLVGSAPAQARSLLETEGYFNAEVKAVQQPGEGGLPVVLVTVRPGPRAVVEALRIDVDGEFKEAIATGDSDATEKLRSLRRDWTLALGEPFRQAEWTSAKNATLARLRAEGYPAANWSTTTAKVDAENNTVQLLLVADSGPLYRLGALRIRGLKNHDEDSISRLSTFTPGTPYTEKLLLDFQERLRKVGLFENAVVTLDPDEDTAKAAPVRVRVRELPLQQATFGVGFSDNAGPRLSLEHTHRRLFGTRWIARNKFELGRDQSSWQGDLTSHPWEDGYRGLIGANLQREEAAGTIVNSSRLRVGRARDTERIERLVFAEALTSTTRNATTTASSRALSINSHWIFRHLDSVLLPTDGYSASTQLGLGYAVSGSAQNGPFLRTYGRLTAYKPLGNSWYGLARVEAGQLFASNGVLVPDTLLFRAGGDDSVRGYAHRSLGPTVAGTVNSGRVLLTGSLEVARPVSPRLPSVWWAAFVDAGNAADHWNDLRPVYGYGVGVRWRSPVGPLRLDLAYGEAIRKMRMHLSVGIAF
jgi:translocation and assembly module TamA